MNGHGGKQHYSVWLARIAAVSGIGSAVIALVGAIGAGQDWWPKMVGLGLMRMAFFVALAGAILGLIVLLLYRKNHQTVVRLCLAGLVFAFAYIGYIGHYLVIAQSVPMIHDISTDVENPPEFKKLELRQDNMSNIPGRGDREFAGMDARERWAFLHREAYGDIQPLTVNMGVADTVTLAEKVAIDRGWVVAVADRESGHLEATDTVSLLAFKDDIIVRVTPGKAAGTSIIDVRSVSRIGLSDLGVNAKRVRAFLKEMKKRASAG